MLPSGIINNDDDDDDSNNNNDNNNKRSLPRVAVFWLRFDLVPHFGLLAWATAVFSVCTRHSLAIRSFLLVFAFVRNMLSSLTSEILAILLLFISELGGNGKLGYFG